jgi:hypothetical protein
VEGASERLREAADGVAFEILDWVEVGGKDLEDAVEILEGETPARNRAAHPDGAELVVEVERSRHQVLPTILAGHGRLIEDSGTVVAGRLASLTSPPRSAPATASLAPLHYAAGSRRGVPRISV